MRLLYLTLGQEGPIFIRTSVFFLFFFHVRRPGLVNNVRWDVHLSFRYLNSIGWVDRNCYVIEHFLVQLLAEIIPVKMAISEARMF